MFDQVLDTFRKATESTMQFQQDMFRQWTQQCSNVPGAPTIPSGTEWTDQAQSFQKEWAQSFTDTLKKHRQALDAQYAIGIKIIEDAFRVAEVKDPEQFRKLTEELWRNSFECLKSLAEDQMRELQALGAKWQEVVAKGLTPAKA